MTHSLHTAIQARLLAVAEARNLTITVADVTALTTAAVTAAYVGGGRIAPVTLTDSQIGAMAALACGESTEQTAARMFLTASTVKTHRRLAYRKLGAHTAGHAVAVAISYGLLGAGLPLQMPGTRRSS